MKRETTRKGARSPRASRVLGALALASFLGAALPASAQDAPKGNEDPLAPPVTPAPPTDKESPAPPSKKENPADQKAPPPSAATPWIERGAAKMRSGDYDGAIADYVHAITLDARSAAAWEARGEARLAKSDLDGAISDFTKAIELSPRFALAWRARSEARAKRGDADGAKADAARAEELDPMGHEPRGSEPTDGERRLAPAHTIYECPKCRAQSLVGGKCPHCDVDLTTRTVSDPKPEATAKVGADSGDPADAKARAYKDDNMAKGDYYFKTGYYIKASESYRVAVLADPANPWKKLAFGHALFAIGNYSYASYALRRAVTQLDPQASFTPDVASLFPSKRGFEKAVKDLKLYVKYSPRDPAGLSVLGYMHYAQGDDEKAKEMFTYLQRLPKNENDKFAEFFMKQIEARKGKIEPPAPSEPEPELTPPLPKKETKPEPKAVPAPTKSPVPEASREDESPAPVKPQTAPARSE